MGERVWVVILELGLWLSAGLLVQSDLAVSCTLAEEDDLDGQVVPERISMAFFTCNLIT